MRNNKNNFGFDWDDFNHSFKQGSNKHLNPAFSMDFDWIEDVIKTSIDRAFSSNPMTPKNPFDENHSDIIETHDYMLVKVPIPENTNIREIGVFLDANVLMITGIKPKKEFITLPTNGSYTGSRAYYKDGMLEIRIPKNEKQNFREIMVKYLS